MSLFAGTLTLVSSEQEELVRRFGESDDNVSLYLDDYTHLVVPRALLGASSPVFQVLVVRGGSFAEAAADTVMLHDVPPEGIK